MLRKPVHAATSAIATAHSTTQVDGSGAIASRTTATDSQTSVRALIGAVLRRSNK